MTYQLEDLLKKENVCHIIFELLCPFCLDLEKPSAKFFKSKESFSRHLGQHYDIDRSDRIKLRHYAGVYNKMLQLKMIGVRK